MVTAVAYASGPQVDNDFPASMEFVWLPRQASTTLPDLETLLQIPKRNKTSRGEGHMRGEGRERETRE